MADRLGGDVGRGKLFGFHRRKQLLRVVRTIASLDAPTAEAVIARAGLRPDVRPETLAPEDFARLVVELDR